MRLWVQVMTEIAHFSMLCCVCCFVFLSVSCVVCACIYLQITKEELLADVARDILLYISRDLTDEVHVCTECV